MTKERTVIWHNPRCSKSRQTLDLLRSRGIEPEVVEYLKHPPEPEEIAAVVAMLGIEPRELMRSCEPVYREKSLDGLVEDRERIAAMVHDPILIQRPVVIHKDRAAIGRPPENVLDIF